MVVLVFQGCRDKVPQTSFTLLRRKQKKIIVSQFWRLEVQDQGVGRVGSEGCEGKSVTCPSSRFGGLLAIFGVSWLVQVSPQSPS